MTKWSRHVKFLIIKQTMGHYKHGMVYSPEWFIWRSMRNRCSNPKHPSYKNYGGRGITVCDRWEESFINFYEDMGARPSKDHSLDRINNNLGYNKENCRWATDKEQRRNTRRNIFLTLDGKTMCLEDWAKQLKIKPDTLKKRIDSGWSDERVLTTLKRKWEPEQPQG